MLKMRLKRFFKPNIIKISIAFLCLGLTLKFIVPLLEVIRIVPCKIITPTGYNFGLCPLNPDPAASQINSYYLGIPFLDLMYQIFYLLFIVAILPYTLACIIFLFYYKYIKKIIGK